MSSSERQCGAVGGSGRQWAAAKGGHCAGKRPLTLTLTCSVSIETDTVPAACGPASPTAEYSDEGTRPGEEKSPSVASSAAFSSEVGAAARLELEMRRELTRESCVFVPCAGSAPYVPGGAGDSASRSIPARSVGSGGCTAGSATPTPLRDTEPRRDTGGVLCAVGAPPAASAAAVSLAAAVVAAASIMRWKRSACEAIAVTIIVSTDTTRGSTGSIPSRSSKWTLPSSRAKSSFSRAHDRSSSPGAHTCSTSTPRNQLSSAPGQGQGQG